MTKKLHPFLLHFPEYYLALLFLLSGYRPPFSFHPIAMGLSCLFLLQALLARRWPGMIIATLFLSFNLLMLAPLIAEAVGLIRSGGSAWALLTGGILLWSINGLAGGLMLFKYQRREQACYRPQEA